ncbi:MAG: tetratricopeptide repeat protein [Caulobacteraceae bacterium]|nr:tetratricopeptide repeat protein [Caulobacteraceae bacterium]
MSVRRPRDLNRSASTVAMATADGQPPAAPRLFNDDMGDSASKAALAKLNTAVAELRALTVRPLLQRAIAAIGAEDHKTAADLALKVLQRDERNGYGWYILAIAREKAGDFKGSISCYESALALLPNHGDIANDLGRLAFRLGLKEEAAKFFAHYRAAHPDCAQGANNLACALRDLHDYEGAIGVLRPAIQAHPESSPLWNTLGTILSEQGQSANAMIFFEEALRCEPSFAKARYNLANAKLDIGDLEGALADCEAAMKIASTPADLTMMRLARSTMLLCAGRVGEGWDDYEARIDPNFADVTHFMIDRPRWTPGADLAGKSMLLMGEQGLGDEVAFANVIPDILEALGPEGKLTIAVEPRLIPLFQRAFPTAEIGAHATYKVDAHTIRGAPFVDQAKIDLWTPIASLLRHFRRSPEAFPNRPRYMIADPVQVDHWRGQIASLPGLKVGLLWKSLKLDGSRLRQFSPFEQWRPVLETKGVSFVNLQYGDCAAELAQAKAELGIDIHQPQGIDLKQDLDGVAALSCAMDLIIGPANATSSIAAACGAPLWMISAPGAWPRMGTDRYPWYPQVRAFIPGGFHQWGQLMPQVAEALAGLT